jgi:hypothetical protein
VLAGYSTFRVTVVRNETSDRFEGTFSGGNVTIDGSSAGQAVEGTIAGQRLISVP